MGHMHPILIREIINLMYTPKRSVYPIMDGMHIHPALSEVLERDHALLPCPRSTITTSSNKITNSPNKQEQGNNSLFVRDISVVRIYRSPLVYPYSSRLFNFLWNP